MAWYASRRLDPDRVYVSSPQGTLVEYLAVRLILDRLARPMGLDNRGVNQGPLSELRDF